MYRFTSPKIKSLSYYLSLIVAVCIALQYVTGFIRMDLKIPAADGGSDYLPIFYQMKTMTTGESFPFTGLQSPRLGFPFGADWNDYPMNHSLFYSLIRFIGIFSKNWAVVFNVYWIGTYILSALTFAFVLKKLSLRSEVAFGLSILFSFLPFHFFRMGHIWLCSYFMVPLQVLVLLQIWDRDPVFFGNTPKEGTFWDRNQKKILTTVILLLSGWAGIYYVFFFFALAGFAMISASIQYKSIRHIFSVLVLFFISILSVLLDSIPTILKNLKYGVNLGGFDRTYAESEFYGLKIAQLFIPSPVHRIADFAIFGHSYNTLAPLVTENHTATLGIVGVVGFTSLIFFLFADISKKGFLNNIAKLNIAAVLTGTIGGFGTLFAIFVSPSIRGYNRISVFIAMFSLICIGYFFSELYKRTSKFIYYPLLIGVCLLGIWDQTSENFRFNQPVGKFNDQKKFFSQIESLAGDSPVYQLPAVDFPDSFYYNRLTEYEQLRGYLFTEKTRWSFGNIFGRYQNAWLQNRSYQESTLDFLKEIAVTGFKFVYLNRLGYSDNGVQMVGELSEILGKPVLESSDGTIVFFDMSEFLKSKSDFGLDRQQLLESPAFTYGPGGITFSHGSKIGYTAKIPCPSTIYLFNPKKVEQTAEVSFTIDESPTQNLTLRFLGERVEIAYDKLPYTFKGRFPLLPGRTSLLFEHPSRPHISIRGFSIKPVN